MFKSLVVLAVFVAVTVALRPATLVKDNPPPRIDVCSKPGALLKDLKVKLTPDSITPGVKLTASVSGTLTRTVKDAKATLKVEFEGVPLLNKEFDPCTLKDAPMKCPIEAGPFHYSATHTVPQIPLTGTIAVTSYLFDEPSGKEIMCLKISAYV